MTTNFDEVLARALRLFGYDVVTCDHPKTTQRIDPKQLDTLQIVHVHGTHWFYDCCNLKSEIENQAQRDLFGNLSMGQLLDRLLFDRSPLVVGYSGWEGDVLMTSLERRLLQPMPYNIYWFCFSRKDASDLPVWMREHQSVRLVVPPAGVVERRSTPEGERRAARDLIVAVPNAPEGVDRADQEPTLPARLVFEALIQKLELKAPELTIDPIRFFAGHLEKNLTMDGEGGDKDIYLLKEVVDRLKAAVSSEHDLRAGVERAQREVTALLTIVNDAVRRSEYRLAVQNADLIRLEHLSDTQASELDAALEAVYLASVSSDAPYGLSACELRERLAARMIKKGDAAPGWLLRLSKAIHGQGQSLHRLNRRQEAIVAYDRVIAQINGARDPDLQNRIALAFANKAVVLGEEGRRAEQIALCDELVDRFGRATDPIVRARIADTIQAKAFALRQEGKAAEELATYDEMVARFGDATETALQERVAAALSLKAFALARQGRVEEARAVFDDVVVRFDTATEPGLREFVVNAIANRGILFGREGERREEIAIYDELVARFGTASESPLRELVAKVLMHKGFALLDEGKSAEAIVAFDDVVARFGAEIHPVLREEVAEALVTKGVTLGEQGKRTEAIATYDEVVARFGTASEPQLRDMVATAIVNKEIALVGER